MSYLKKLIEKINRYLSKEDEGYITVSRPPFEINTVDNDTRTYKPNANTRIFKTLQKALQLDRLENLEFEIVVKSPGSFKASGSQKGSMTMSE